jgi:multicomponent Na+:H+ antiporter subunit C
MNPAYAILVGLLYAAGVYLLLRRSIMKLVFGLLLVSQATNLLLFVAGGMTRGKPPFAGDEVVATDPLPHALILTAIVIGFGVVAFALVLMFRFYKTTGTEDLDDLKEGEKSG